MDWKHHSKIDVPHVEKRKKDSVSF